MRNLSREDVFTFYKSHICLGENRRKMSCHVVSTCEGGAGTLTETEDTETQEERRIVTDITNFKSSSPLFPLAQPFVELESLVRLENP